MIAPKNLLAPTDFSEFSEVAVRYAKEFATAFNATLHLIHVLEDPTPLARSASSYAMLPDIRHEMLSDANEQLNQLLTSDEDNQITTEKVAIWGEPFVEIIRYAREQDIDIIVLGTHGRGAVAHSIMGSVAERLVRKAPCPVLTVRHPEHEFVMP